MSQRDENAERTSNMERLREEAATCEPGCACNAGPSGRTRWIVGASVIVVAGVLFARALLKSDGGAPRKADAGFSLSQNAGAASEAVPIRQPDTSDHPSETAAPGATSNATDDNAKDKPFVCGVSIRSLGDLNQKAMDKDGVFVFLAGRDAARNREIGAIIEKGAATLRGRSVRVGVFTLAAGSREYTNIARQVPPPGVFAMVKGRGAVPVRGEITEPKLIQAFVAAASAGGCGPSGCGPSSSGCN